MSSDAQPAVSVIVPCYNLGAYLDEAVDSVLAQTCQDFEIVIVNDGSTDHQTNRLLADYDRPRTRVIQSHHRGLAGARNLAIAHARGRYLCALDADDKLAPTFLEKAVKRLDADPTLTFVSCWLETFGTEQWVWKQERCDLATLLGECTVATPAVVRAAAVREVGGYDEQMPHAGYEDWDLWISLTERGFRGTIIPEVLFHYRRRPGSMSETCTRGDAHLALMRYLVTKHEASFREHLLELLIMKEAVTADLLRTTYALEREIHGALLPTIKRRREELAALQRRLAAVERTDVMAASREEPGDGHEIAALRAALAAARAEIAALRRSGSWRVTAPLRAGVQIARRVLNRLGPRSANGSRSRRGSSG